MDHQSVNQLFFLVVVGGVGEVDEKKYYHVSDLLLQIDDY
ncbi:unnamed protein product [Schistosoma mattheei]|uniref:Uncharacterized protein n=1 Tax=Schistosoma mattheei TaxID=31246 RepID=A0A3P8BVJ1_9TREM|nr:unnamed protein product [Schistosoma mattheei]